MIRGDIAIVGMACLLPGAPDLETYWQNIVSKVDAITDPPSEAWEAEVFYDPRSSANDRVYCKRGGFIGPLTYFDPLEHGVMPRAVEGSEPDQWLALQVARAAFADAGYGDDIPERERTAVILGKGTYLNRGNLSVVQHGRVLDQTLEILKTLHPEYAEADLQLIRQELKRHLPSFSADTVPGLIPNIMAGRIANRLNLMGPNYTVDAACASSLVAVDIAVRELLTHQYDLALVGGAHVVTPVPVLMLFCQLNALSHQEKIRPFDKNADGTILGEGVGMMVLKRLEDALRDGHRIYAVIKGVGVSSDGSGMSVMAPRVEGEVLALRRAYDMAGLSPRTVGLIEAHGTGTPVGDETEVQALAQVFGPAHGAPPWCALGSVKSMIGHVMPAAGIAGLIKAALALYHKILPPTLNVETPNPRLKLDDAPFYLNTETRPWIHQAHAAPRRAGINAFGFGGINAHVILEEHAAADATAHHSHLRNWETEVCILAAETRPLLLERLQRIRRCLQVGKTIPLRDLAYTLNTSLGEGAYRLAVVAATLDDLQHKLERAAQRLSDPGCRQIKDVQGIYFFEEPVAASGQLAFLFPGEGSQYVHMLADLCLHFPEVREHFDQMDRVFSQHARGHVPSDLIFPRPAFSEAERGQAEEKLWQMEGAIEAVLTANRALFTLLSRLELRPDCVVGHSTGEYSAMLASGMLPLDTEELVGQFSMELNRIYREAAAADGLSRATLVAVAAPAEKVAALVREIGGDLFVAMDNCPHQTVLAGEAGSAERALERLRGLGLIYERLPFDRPYHTPLFKNYIERLRPFFSKWIHATPRLKTYSCTTMSPFAGDGAHNQDVIVEHWLRPVEFRKTVEAMYADGMRLFVEVGPGGSLTSFVDDILRGRPHLAVPANLKSRSGITQLNHLVGLLAAQAVPLKLDYLYKHRSPRKLDLERLPEPGSDERKSNSRLKLATGWPATGISAEVAARLRPKSQPASVSREPSPVADAGRANDSTEATSQPATPAARSDNPPAAMSNGNPVGAPQPPQPMKHSAAEVMSAYLRAMNQFLSVQQDVMQAFLTRQTTPPAPAGIEPQSADRGEARVESSPAPADAPHAPPAPQPPQPETPDASDVIRPGPLTAEAIQEVLLRLVSERTGYPPEMLDLDLDLEAHLGIDSIKRVETLGTFQRQTGLALAGEMEALSGLKTLRGVIEFLASRVAPATPAEPMPAPEAPPSSSMAPVFPSLPLISSVTSLTPGEALVARCELRAEEALFLRDHTLGRQVSLTDPDLRGLPIVPLTISMEMLAEAASLLLPGRRLIGMRDVRAYRWLALEDDATELQLVARRKPSAAAQEVYVCIREAEAAAEGHSPNSTPIIEGTMIFSEVIPEPTPAGEFALQAERRSTWAADGLYRDGMFHGPAFQGVLSLDRIGDDGAEATLAVGSTDDFFRSDPHPAFITDPVLLDQPGQVVGLWTAECLDTAYVIFPFYLEALHLYAYPKTAERARCRARIHLIGEQRVRSDLDIIGLDERVWARLVGWEDRRFDLPRAFHRFLLSPQEVTLSQPWPAPVASLPSPADLLVYRLSLDAFPKNFFVAHGGLWGRVLAHLILSRRERALWRSLRSPELRRIEWLLGRVAAKDAVREHVRRRHAMALCPADVEILPDENGRPLVRGSWVERLPCAPTVSLSHSGGVAVAAVGLGEAGAAVGVGIDIERVGHMRDEAEGVAFTPPEQELLSSVRQAAPDEWPLRLWCAKEAAAKALGHGLRGGPQALVVQALDASRGMVHLVPAGELARRAQERNTDSTLTAFTVREDGLIAAVCLGGVERPTTEK